MGSEAGEPGALYRKALEKMNCVSLRASKGILWMDVARRRRMSSERRRFTSWYCCSGVASFSGCRSEVQISFHISRLLMRVNMCRYATGQLTLRALQYQFHLAQLLRQRLLRLCNAKSAP